MSDPTNPYAQQGQPQQPSYPPAQPAYPPAYGGSYGAQPAQPPGAYGYGSPSSAPDTDKRPGRVTAAAVITIVFSVLGLLLGALGAVGVAVSRSDMIDRINDRAANDDQLRRSLDQISPDTVLNILIGAAAVLAVWSLIAIGLGIGVLRRSRVSRVLLTISAVMTALVSLIAILSVFSAITLIAAIVVVVLLFGGTSSSWFARRATA